MKRIGLLMLFVFGVLNGAWAQDPNQEKQKPPEPKGELALHSSFWGPQIYLEEQRLTHGEITRLMQNTPPALEAYQTHRTEKFISHATCLTALVLIVADRSITGNQATHNVMLGVASGVLVSGVVFVILQDKHLKQSVNLYNESLKNKSSGNPKLGFELTANGARVSMEF